MLTLNLSEHYCFLQQRYGVASVMISTIGELAELKHGTKDSLNFIAKRLKEACVFQVKNCLGLSVFNSYGCN